MPPLPSGMLLLSPTFAGAQLLPKIPSPAHALKKAMPRLHASVLLRALPYDPALPVRDQRADSRQN